MAPHLAGVERKPARQQPELGRDGVDALPLEDPERSQPELAPVRIEGRAAVPDNESARSDTHLQVDESTRPRRGGMR